MIALGRVIIIFLYFISVCVFGLLFCLFRPFHPDNVYYVSMWMARTSRLLGVEIEVRTPSEVENLRSCVYVANHQNSLDLFFTSPGVRPHTATLGKKSLRWIPFFGQLYWLSGNILIDRKNKGKARNTISQTVANIKERNIGVFIFPEGTRSYGRGLLPFKSGAFHTAIAAEVPLVPICISSTENQVKLNRWNNGKIIVEFLAPVELHLEDRGGVKDLIEQVHGAMKQKIAQLDEELGAAGGALKEVKS